MTCSGCAGQHGGPGIDEISMLIRQTGEGGGPRICDGGVGEAGRKENLQGGQGRKLENEYDTRETPRPPKLRPHVPAASVFPTRLDI